MHDGRLVEGLCRRCRWGRCWVRWGHRGRLCQGRLGCWMQRGHRYRTCWGLSSRRRGLNSGRRGPNSGRRGPNSGRQGLNSGRRGPNSGRRGLNSGRRGPSSGRRGLNSGRRGLRVRARCWGDQRLKRGKARWGAVRPRCTCREG